MQITAILNEHRLPVVSKAANKTKYDVPIVGI